MKIARIALRAILFCVVAAWVANIATLSWIRLAVTVDQFLAVVIGVGTAMVLLDDFGPRRALWRPLICRTHIHTPIRSGLSAI